MGKKNLIGTLSLLLPDLTEVLKSTPKRNSALRGTGRLDRRHAGGGPGVDRFMLLTVATAATDWRFIRPHAQRWPAARRFTDFWRCPGPAARQKQVAGDGGRVAEVVGPPKPPSARRVCSAPECCSGRCRRQDSCLPPQVDVHWCRVRVHRQHLAPGGVVDLPALRWIQGSRAPCSSSRAASRNSTGTGFGLTHRQWSGDPGRPPAACHLLPGSST